MQRWLKFSKYLPENGWQPVIYTPDGGEQAENDASLAKDISADLEVVTRPIWEPYQWYKRFVGQDKKEKIHTGFLSEQAKPSRLEQLAVWIRGNLFIPDARKYWIQPSVRFLSDYLKKQPVDLIISTGPPHSMHLIALGLKKTLGLPWMADFRDPWTGIDYYEDLKLTAASDRKHHRLEAEVLRTADHVVSVGEHMGKELTALGAKSLSVITNGYDGGDFADHSPALDKEFTLAHIGSMTRTRNPEVLWKALASLKKEAPQLLDRLRVRLIGKVDHTVRAQIRSLELSDHVDILPYRPHAEIVDLLRRSRALLLVVNRSKNQKGIVTGKLFEYLASGRPIVCVGPVDGEAARIISETRAGQSCGYDDIEKMKSVLEDLLGDKPTHDSDPSQVMKYERRALTTSLAQLMDEVTSEQHTHTLRH